MTAHSADTTYNLNGFRFAAWSLGLSLIWIATFGSAQADQDEIRINPDQRWLNWYPKHSLPAATAKALPDYCTGDYLPNRYPPVKGDHLEAESEYFEWDNGRALLSGRVEMRHGDLIIHSDQATWDDRQRQGAFTDHVRVIGPYATLVGDSARFQQTGDSLREGRLTLSGAYYQVPESHIHGQAGTLTTHEDDQIDLKNATLTFCEPGDSQWQLAASSIHLDQQKGVGSAWNTRLEIYDIPVFYVPYYRFPIGEQRTTGFLNPSFSFGGNGELETLQTPFYLNIAPNLDATVTPSYVNQHGWLWGNQLRHKTRWLGDGELNYALLRQDHTRQEERSLINYQQSGTLGQHWSHEWVYNKVSDEYYFSDLGNSGITNRTTHLPRQGIIQYQREKLTLQLMVEAFQTIDTSIELADRPYRRMPQISLQYEQDWASPNEHQLFSTHYLEATRFERDHSADINDSLTTLTGFDALNARRLVVDNGLFYRWSRPWVYLMPGAEYRFRQYRLFGAPEATLDDDQSLDIQASLARYSLDAGLYLDREFQWRGTVHTQTLEPRIYWVKSPYLSGQEAIPTFDTKLASVNYEQLFTGQRYAGYDRLEDLNQTSLGLTSRWLSDQGHEWLTLSLGRVFYHADRHVNLDTLDTSTDEQDETDAFNESAEADPTQPASSYLMETQWRPNQQLTATQLLEWDPYQNIARQQRFHLSYAPLGYQQHKLRLFNLGSNRVQSPDSTTGSTLTHLHQVDASLFWSLDDRWALTGRLLRDLNSYDTDSTQPVSPVLESLAGIEYQNCCWRFQLMYRESSTTDDENPLYSTNKNYRFMLSVQFKGLATLGGGPDAVLNEGVPGYSRRQYHDH